MVVVVVVIFFFVFVLEEKSKKNFFCFYKGRCKGGYVHQKKIKNERKKNKINFWKKLILLGAHLKNNLFSCIFKHCSFLFSQIFFLLPYFLPLYFINNFLYINLSLYISSPAFFLLLHFWLLLCLDCCTLFKTKNENILS